MTPPLVVEAYARFLWVRDQAETSWPVQLPTGRVPDTYWNQAEVELAQQNRAGVDSDPAAELVRAGDAVLSDSGVGGREAQAWDEGFQARTLMAYGMKTKVRNPYLEGGS